MIPVDQTTFYDPQAPIGEQRGNCWTACIASLVEREIDEVPNFVQLHVDGGQHWFTHTWEWLQANGYRLVQHSLDSVPMDSHVIRTGKSPRGEGLYHAVLYLGDEVSHDPHPSRAGLLSLESIYEVVEA